MPKNTTSDVKMAHLYIDFHPEKCAFATTYPREHVEDDNFLGILNLVALLLPSFSDSLDKTIDSNEQYLSIKSGTRLIDS